VTESVLEIRQSDQAEVYSSARRRRCERGIAAYGEQRCGLL
jgi:hypothetical protein